MGIPMSRELLFSVSIEDCIVETMRNSKGAGGQKRDKTSSKIRLRHEPSGASSICGDYREQSRNKREAFIRLVNSPLFIAWRNVKTAALMGMKSIDDRVAEQMAPSNIRTEVREDGRWVVFNER